MKLPFTALAIAATTQLNSVEANLIGSISSVFGSGGLGQTRPVPGSLCPCFQLQDLIDAFEGIPLEQCELGLLAEDFSKAENRACTGNWCRGGDPHCVFRAGDANKLMEDISTTEEEHCFVNLDTFCALYATLVVAIEAPTASPTKGATPSPTGSPPTASPTASPTTNPTQSPTASPTVAATTTSPTGSPTATSTTTSPTTAPTHPVVTEVPTTSSTRATTESPVTDPPTASPTASSTQTPTAVTESPATDSPTSIPTQARTASPTTDSPQTSAPSAAPPAAVTDSPTGTPFAPSGYAFTMTNAQDGNEILMFERNVVTGTIHFLDSFPTGGIGGAAQEGPNDPLASQDSMILVNDQYDQCLMAVNAGSDSLSTFHLAGNELILSDVQPTFGQFPLSIAQHDDIVYVLNAGGEGSITGYKKNLRCMLEPIPGSTRSLNIQYGENPPLFLVAPAQIGFTPDGSYLIVLIKGREEGSLLLFPMQPDGYLVAGSEPVRTRSVGFTPFAFEFDVNGNLLVAEGFGTATQNPVLERPTLNAGAVSSYEIDYHTGELHPITASRGTDQTATCWVRQHASSQCAYTTNNGNANSISSLFVEDSGALQLVESVAAQLDTPLDMSIVDDFLYVLSTGHRADGQPNIHVYQINTGSCELELVQATSEHIPHEDVTFFGVVGLVTN